MATTIPNSTMATRIPKSTMATTIPNSTIATTIPDLIAPSTFFAQLNANNIVINIIAADAPFVATLPNSSTYVQTLKNGNSMRARPAVIGGSYDPKNDVFINIKPYPSWTLNSVFEWEAPILKPSAPVGSSAIWSELNQSWSIFTPPNTANLEELKKEFDALNNAAKNQGVQGIQAAQGTQGIQGAQN